MAALYTIINVFTLVCILFAFICVKKMNLLKIEKKNSYSPLLQKSYKYSTLQGEPLKLECKRIAYPLHAITRCVLMRPPCFHALHLFSTLSGLIFAWTKFRESKI